MSNFILYILVKYRFMYFENVTFYNWESSFYVFGKCHFIYLGIELYFFSYYICVSSYIFLLRCTYFCSV